MLRSVTSVISLLNWNTRVIWPIRPLASITGWPIGDLLLRALVEHQLAGERVAGFVEHFGQYRTDRRALARAGEVAQPLVLVGELLDLQQRLGVERLDPLELGVLLAAGR